MARAFTFPGQGSQAVGMGWELAEVSPAAREVFEEVDDVLEQRLSRLMWQGPEEELMLTENAQPALMAVSVAVMRTLEREGGVDLARSASFVAGHSLGEYSALTCARALTLADAARLLKTRGLAMQRAVPVGQGAMAAMLGLDIEAVEEIARDAAEDDVCEVANDNAPGQVVISGDKEAIERAIALAKERGGKRSILLPVSAPFHCALMEPASEEMAVALEEVTITPPVVPLIANVTAEPVSDPETIRRLLVDQVTKRVRWRETIIRLAEAQIDTTLEIGAGKVLTGMVKRIERDLAALSVGSPTDIEAALKIL